MAKLTALVALAFCGFAISAHADGNYSQSFTATPSGWSAVPALSAWNVSNGEYRNSTNTASPATVAYYDGNTWTSNYTYKAKVTSEWASGGNQVGIVFGLTDSSHYYAALVNMAGAVTLNKISGTTNTTLESKPVTPADVQLAEDTPFNLEIFVNRRKDPDSGANDDNEVTVRVNGRVAIAKFRMAPVTGKIGVIARADMGHFDDVTVTDNLAARMFRGTFTGLDAPLQLALDPDSCTPTHPFDPDSDDRYNCWGSITGQDQSGDTWPFHLWGSDARLQYNSKAKDPVVQDYADAALVSVPGRLTNPDGTIPDTGALSFVLKKMFEPSHPPQILYNAEPLPTVSQHDLYMRFWAKVPAASKLSYWHSFFQMKTSSDYRLIFNFETNSFAENPLSPACPSGTPHWVVRADGAANSTATEPYWEICNSQVPVPIDRWFKIEMFMHRSKTGTGRFWVAIDNQKIFDRRDPDGLYFVNADTGVRSTQPIQRLLMPQLYAGDTYPKYELVDDLEVWDGFPHDASPH